MKSISFSLIVALLLTVGASMAQQNLESKQGNIIEALSNADSVTNATVKIYQDKRIEKLISNRHSNGGSKQVTASGYRVQVFSSNAQRTGKNDAFRIEKQIRDEFPEQAIYVNYDSPFWKVRVGDFKTQAQAQAFRSQLISTFPQMRSEIYLVREQIIISNK
ncbi:MAG: SPOR domain-containing protein [Paludibacter sp.]|nr:SPOR domain-containing protein [Paludibacter sp.]